MTDLRFMRFIQHEIFPGGQLPSKEDVEEFSRAAEFACEEVLIK
jgi:cyclopropane-fatty-acyl-phospholipid synthase